MNLNALSLEQLVTLVTREVMASLPVLQNKGCCGCSACQGNCVQDCPAECRLTVQAGASRLSAASGVGRVAGDLAGMIDHTLLKPEATEAQIVKLCEEARSNGFATVCINPTWVRLAAGELRGSGVGVCTVVGFPLGATLPEVKAFEAERCILDGASEIDMVINVGALKSRQYRTVEHDIARVVQASHSRNALVKVIIEAALLTDEEKVEASALAKSACADYVKTSTGFGPGGATVADVALMRRVVGPDLGVKAAGGVRNLADARGMIEAGATRIGASAGVKIVQEASGRAESAPSAVASTPARGY